MTLMKKVLDPGACSRVYNAYVNGDSQPIAFLRSGEMARLAGISTDTLRHYERKGLLPPPRRSANGYREYPLSTLDRVRLIQRALSVGFTLEELSRILKLRDKGGVPCHGVRALAEKKLAEVENQLSQIMALRDDLRSTLKEWDAMLAERAATGRAGLLDALATSGYGSRARRPAGLRNSIGQKNPMKEID